LSKNHINKTKKVNVAFLEEKKKVMKKSDFQAVI